LSLVSTLLVPSVALKSHTSKLVSYDDLLDVASFGFRGEALSSLCQLADVTVTTATAANAPMGSVLTFDRRGQLLSSCGKVARPVGAMLRLLLPGRLEDLMRISAALAERYDCASLQSLRQRSCSQEGV
jgi:hypothetical protein